MEAVELSRCAAEGFPRRHEWLRGTLAVRFSDAHFLHKIGSQPTLLQMAACTIAKLRVALRAEAGRCIEGYLP